MTLPPLDQDIAFSAEGPGYKVGPHCSNPGCSRLADHAHHIFRRTKMGKPVDWVEIDGWVVANKTGLCWRCHQAVTGDVGGHTAAIRLDLEHRVFQWCLIVEQHGLVTDYPFAGLLDPQPPTPETVTSERAAGQPESEACPHCGHIMRARAVRRGPARARKTWPVLVPDDEQEHGAEVLDSLVESLAPLIPNADTTRAGRYYVLVPVLAYAAMNPHRFIETLEGVGA